jgi:hypothetical protein
MHHRAEYLLQVLEKIGAPLMASIITVNARQGDSQLHNEAQKIAELLAKTVQTSIDMSHSLDLGPTGEMSDSVRIALTGLAGPLVAGAFRNTAKSPTDPEIKRMIAALQAVLTFAENFEANSENSDRLKNISAEGQSVDSAQSYVQYINAFIPVINAAGIFSFGQPEQKLLMDVSSRLSARATQMREKLFGNAGADNKRAELGILRALSEIFVACHEAETARIQALNDDARAQMQTSDGISQETLWKNFDVRAAMLEVLSQGSAANTPMQGSGSSGSVRPQPSAPVPPITAAAPATPPPAAPPAPQQPANPMSMFKKPDAPANQETLPPQQQQAVGQNIPPQTLPPGGNPGNPMSFFKTPPKDS